MNRDALERVMRGSRTLDLVIETMECPDLEVPIAGEPTHFVMRIAGRAITAYTPSGCRFQSIDEAAHLRLLSLAESALAEGDIAAEMDTALSRPITTILLRLDDQMGSPRTARVMLNHLGDRGTLALAGWTQLLGTLGDLIAPRGIDLVRWTHTMRFFSPTVRVPRLVDDRVHRLMPGCHAWALRLRPNGVYLRLGQPPEDSPLFWIVLTSDGADIHWVNRADGGARVGALDVRAAVPARWVWPLDEEHYRQMARGHEVEVSLCDRDCVTILAPNQGRGVYLQVASSAPQTR